MTTRPFRTLLFASVLAGVEACGSSTTTNVTSPTSVRCQASLTADASSFTSSGGTGSASVSVSRECEWSAATGAPWIVITAGSRGQGNGTIAFRVDANVDPVARRGALTVGGSQVELSQDAAPCRFDVSGPSGALPGDGGDTSIDVRTHPACTWTAVSAEDWAGVAPTSGSGNAAIRVTVAPNTGQTRMASVTIAGQRVTVTQLAMQPPAPTPTPAPAPTPTPPPSPPPGPTPAPAPSPSPSPTPSPSPSPSPSPVPVSPIDLDGKVDSLSGACPLVTFDLGGRTVFTTTSTEFRKMQCRDLKNGTKVKVRGFVMSDGTVRADRVEKA